MIAVMDSFNAFTEKVIQFLKNEKGQGFIEFYICNMECAQDVDVVKANGRWHSKFPAQSGGVAHLTLQFRIKGGDSGLLEYTGLDFFRFVFAFEKAKKCVVPLTHHSHVYQHAEYPSLRLCDPDLVKIVNEGKALQKVDELVTFMDKAASEVTHPNLMGREVGAGLSLKQRVYTDSSGNLAREPSAFGKLTVSYALTDSAEYAFDMMGQLPTFEDCQRVVKEASKNLVKVEVKKLEDAEKTSVLLTHKALLTLFEELVIPNFSVRSILDGTGAWEVEHLGKGVLENVTVYDNPHVDYSPFSSAFDSEGTPTRKVTILEKGVLVHPLFTSRLLAELEGMCPEMRGRFALTGHAVSSDAASSTNLFIEVHAPQKPFEALISDYPRVAVVNSLTGFSVDPLTGQFALDAEGVKIYDKGTLSSSTSVTLRGNFFEALKHKDNLCGPMERYFNSWAPSLLTQALDCVAKEMASQS